jgi:hypothetical protein
MHPLRIIRPPGCVLVGLAGAAAMVSVLAAAGCGAAPAAAAGRPVPSPAIGRLTAMAYRTAAMNGDPAPAWITAVLTTCAKALTSATPGDYVPGSAFVKVFLITMRGHFTTRDATGPLEQKRRPAGTCPWSSTPRPSRAWTSASAPNRRQSHPPASDRSPISLATGTDRSRQITPLPYRPRDASCAEPPLSTAILSDLTAGEAPAGLIGAARACSCGCWRAPDSVTSPRGWPARAAARSAAQPLGHKGLASDDV